MVVGIVQKESSFDPLAYHWSEENPADRSYGLMQLTLSTARWLAGLNGYSLYPDGHDVYDPITNLWLGMYYLSWLYNKYGSWGDVISAYNYGSVKLDDSGDYVNYPYVNSVVVYAQQLTGQSPTWLV
jgi:soluble lytic murein transglycosylase-like protein